MASLVQLSEDQRELADRVRRFVDEVLIPYEVAAESAGGRLPADAVGHIRGKAIEARLNGGRHAVEHGGQGWSALDYVVVHEQLGRVTNGLWWHIPDAYNVLSAGTGEQIARYLVPSLRGDATLSYAVTEEHAGSDPSGIRTTARPDGDGWVIDGEKWFVTSGDVATAHVVVAVADGHGPTLFLVDADRPGIETVDDPPFTHNFPHGHPTVRFTGVRVGPDAVLGGPAGLGGAEALQQAWFVEERLGIAVHCVAAMGRLLAEAVDWATGREQGGARIIDHQGVSFPLADSAADAAAARLLVYEVATLADSGADRKVVHAKASLAKLFASEAAYRCADRVVQTFGGRGYLRTYAAERFLRELRVDRIWEGTSEIQRLIITRALERRGVRTVLG